MRVSRHVRARPLLLAGLRRGLPRLGRVRPGRALGRARRERADVRRRAQEPARDRERRRRADPVPRLRPRGRGHRVPGHRRLRAAAAARRGYSPRQVLVGDGGGHRAGDAEPRRARRELGRGRARAAGAGPARGRGVHALLDKTFPGQVRSIRCAPFKLRPVPDADAWLCRAARGRDRDVRARALLGAHRRGDARGRGRRRGLGPETVLRPRRRGRARAGLRGRGRRRRGH